MQYHAEMSQRYEAIFFRIYQGTVATFYRWGGQIGIFLVWIFHDSVYQKLSKSVHFWLSYSRNKNGVSAVDWGGSLGWEPASHHRL